MTNLRVNSNTTYYTAKLDKQSTTVTCPHVRIEFSNSQSNCCRKAISVSLFHVAWDDWPLILLLFSLSFTVDPFFFSDSFGSTAGRSPHIGHTTPCAWEYVFGTPHWRHILKYHPKDKMNYPWRFDGRIITVNYKEKIYCLLKNNKYPAYNEWSMSNWTQPVTSIKILQLTIEQAICPGLCIFSPWEIP